MPTKPLPAQPHIAHLKAQALDLLRAHRAAAPACAQRLREFHPRFRNATDGEIAAAPLKLSDAQLTIAREYGFASWPRLRAFVENPARENLHAPAHERIAEPLFRRAVDLLDAGDAGGLRAHFAQHPQLVRQRVTLEGGNYFTTPALLEFVAENPTRRGRLPRNIVEMTKIVLDAGAASDRDALNSTLSLVASSSVARDSGVRRELIELLCDYGAQPSAGTIDALLYGEFDAAAALIERGAPVDLPVAAALGRLDDVRRLLRGETGAEERGLALSLAAQHGHAGVVAALLDAGADPDRYSPVGGHSHATPLHQAALAGHEDVVELLVQRGARTDIQDIHHGATPPGWAEYAGHERIAAYLRSVAPT